MTRFGLLASGDDEGGRSTPGLNLGRVLVTHDWIAAWGGAERALGEILALVGTSDVVIGVLWPEVARQHSIVERARETWLAHLPLARRNYQWFLPLEAAAFWTLDTSGYDIVISSSHAFSKAAGPGRLGIHLSYCYSPPRYVWDLHDTYAARTTLWRRAALLVGRRPMQVLDRVCANRVTHFVAISAFVATRIQRAYGRRARVVYPPVHVHQAPGAVTRARRDDFLLYLGRLVPYKRVELLILAGQRLNKRVVIAGDGPDRGRLERFAGRGVEFLGRVSDAEAARLLDTCAAFVFCAEEDFGIAPLEANAHGAPVVAFRGGGALETMVDGVTAVLFDEPTPEAVALAISRALTVSWDGDKLLANALRFSPERFRDEFRNVLVAALDGERW